MAVPYCLEVLLCLLVATSPAVAGSCNITGIWLNSLGSVLQLTTTEGNMIRGAFTTTVEESTGAAGSSMLGNVFGVRSASAEPTVAFSVLWAGGSVCTWAGQCFWKQNQQVLKTIWLLRSSVGSEAENWAATRIGEDSFYKVADQPRAPLWQTWPFNKANV
uniref:Avidin n=1 Tax=Sphenodon punctatus TaxID=8508 RepID=A0A8D0GUJ7_SPHPU